MTRLPGAGLALLLTPGVGGGLYATRPPNASRPVWRTRADIEASLEEREVLR